MRIVKSQQTLLSAGSKRAVGEIAEEAGTSPHNLASSSRWQASKRKGRLAIALGAAIGGAAALYGFLTRASRDK
jgi:chemotaxis response regulator CheB